MVAVDTRRISIDQNTDVVSGIYVMPDCIPVVMPMLAAAPQAASEVAQTRPRGDCSVNLLLPMDGSIEPLDDDAPDLLSSGREPAGGSSEVDSDVCVVQDLLPTAVSGGRCCRDVDGKVCLSPGSVSGCFYDEYGDPDVRAGLV